MPSSGPYPTVVKNKSGEPVCIGQAWEYSKAFGLMNVKFDAQGRVSQCGGQAALVIGDRFRRKDSRGAWQPLPADAVEALKARLAADPAVRVVAPDPAAAQTLAGFAGQVATEKARLIGAASEPLCLVRVPGEPANPSARARAARPPAAWRAAATWRRWWPRPSCAAAGAPTSPCRTPAACERPCPPAR